MMKPLLLGLFVLLFASMILADTPSAPIVYQPNESAYVKSWGNISIEYNESVSPLNHSIVSYNITLAYTNQTYISTIIDNNSPNLIYSWDPSAVPVGRYVIMVEACDNSSECATGISAMFWVIDDCTAPVINIESPADGASFSSLANIPPFIFNVTDLYDDEVYCELDIFYLGFFPSVGFDGWVTNDTRVSWDVNSSFIDGYYVWNLYCENSCYNYNETDRDFSVFTPSADCPECCTNETSTINYADAVLPGFDLKTLFGMLFIAIALWGLFHYAIEAWPH